MITKTSLDAAAQECPTCGRPHMAVSISCKEHEAAGLKATYQIGSGVLMLHCSACGSLVGEVCLGEEAQPPPPLEDGTAN